MRTLYKRMALTVQNGEDYDKQNHKRFIRTCCKSIFNQIKPHSFCTCKCIWGFRLQNGCHFVKISANALSGRVGSQNSIKSNHYVPVHENAFENVVCKMAVKLLRFQCVNHNDELYSGVARSKSEYGCLVVPSHVLKLTRHYKRSQECYMEDLHGHICHDGFFCGTLPSCFSRYIEIKKIANFLRHGLRQWFWI